MNNRNLSFLSGKCAAVLLVVVSVFAPIVPVFANGPRLGDLNFDGEITASDALIAEQYANGKITLTTEQRFIGDVDKDGRVGRADALVILKYAVGIVPTLPVTFGDINGDGKILADDSLLVARYIEKGVSLTDAQRVVADVDIDGKITLADVELILRRAVGSVSSLPTYKPEISGATWTQLDWSGKLTGGTLHGYTNIHGLRVNSDGKIVPSFNVPAGRIVGDINNDGYINTEDVTILDRVLVGEDTLTFLERYSADVDGDKRITRADKKVFEAYFLGTVSTLPVQFGDLNKDKNVTTAEAQRILQMAVGSVEGTAYERFVADTTVDGTILASDAQAALRYTEGDLQCLPFLIELADVPCGDSANEVVTGTFTSAVFDAERPVEWMTATSTTSLTHTNGSAGVELYVRTSNDPDSLGEYTKVVNGKIERIGQYAQYKVEFTGTKDAVLSGISLKANYALDGVRDQVPDCTVRGLYGTYYNLPNTHPDVQNGLPYNVQSPNPFERDWYELDNYFAFSRTDALNSLNVSSGFFPVNEGRAGDPHFFATHWSGTLNAAATSSYPFALSSDDDAWLIIDKEVVINNSGIHALKSATSSVALTPGLHAIDIFFADRQVSQSGFTLSIPDNLGVSPCVAEPVFENHAPELSGPDAQTVRVGNTVHFTITASDVDGDDLTFINTLPAGAIFNENTGIFSWAPTTPGEYTATFTVSDGKLTTSHTVKITMLPPVVVNHAPVVDVPVRIEKYLGDTVNFTVNASDPDGDALTATSTLPTGAVFDGASGVFTWTPSAIGEYTAIFTYSDGRLSTTKSTTIVITKKIEVNHAPTISAPVTVSGNTNEIIQFKVTTNDLDGDIVTLSANGVPASAVFDPALGIFNWIHTEAGTVTLVWSATDGKATTTASTVVTVNTATQCVPQVYARVVFTKADNIGTGNLLPRVYVGSAENGLPSGAWFPLYHNGAPITDNALEAYADVQGFAIERQNGNFRTLFYGHHEGGEIIGYPNREDAEGYMEIMKGTILGRYEDPKNRIENSDNVIVANGKLTFDMEVSVAADGFLVDVSDLVRCGGEHLPVWTGPTTLSGRVGESLSATILASDQDGDPLTYTFDLPKGATYSTSTGAFGFMSTSTGAFIAKLWVTDNRGGAAVLHTLTIIISDNPPVENHLPVWSGPTTLSGHAGDSLSAIITASDVDNDVLVYTFELPDGATYSTSTGAFHFSSAVTGTFIAKFFVTDNKGASPVLHTLTVTVSSQEPPQPPPPTPISGGGGGGGRSTPPTLEIYDVRVTDITNTTAIIHWKSNFMGSSRVIYDTFCGRFNAGLSPNFGYGLSSLELPATVMVGGAQEHTVAISGLTRASAYCFRVIATGQGQVISGEGSFSTLGGVLPPPPVVTPPPVRIPAPIIENPVVREPVVAPIVTPTATPTPQTAAVSKVFPLPWWIWVLFFETVVVGVLALRARDDKSRTSHILSALLIPVGFIDWLGMTRATFVQDVLNLPWYIVGTIYLLVCATTGWMLWEERMLERYYGKRTRSIALAVIVFAIACVMIWAFGWGMTKGGVSGIDLLVAACVALGFAFWIWHFGRETKIHTPIAIIGNEPTFNFYTPTDDVSRITV